MPSRVTARGLMVIAALSLATIVALKAYDGVPLKGYDKLYVEVPQVGNLRDHDQVRIAGRRVGQVQKLSITRDGAARLQLQIERSTQALPKDTQVSIRAAGLLGARYVEFTPGRSTQMLQNGDTLRGGVNAKTYGVPELLNTFDAPTRVETGHLGRELGTALMGNGAALNRGLELAAPAQRPFQSIIEAIRARPGALDRFAPAFAAALNPLDANRSGLVEQFRPTPDALPPFQTHRGSMRETLDVAPAALAAANTGLGQGRALVAATRQLATSINATLPAAPAGLRAAQRLLVQAPSTLPATKDLLAAVKPTVPATLKITRSLAPVLKPLGAALDSLLPLNQRVGDYHCDIANFGAVFRSMTGYSSPGAQGDAEHSQGGGAGQFRLQVTPSPDEDLMIESTGAENSLAARDPYPEPCKYVTTRSTVEPLGRGLPK
jgi:ABC-type transporter Mla subunit MlaD